MLEFRRQHNLNFYFLSKFFNHLSPSTSQHPSISCQIAAGIHEIHPFWLDSAITKLIAAKF
jgi:hypothetical protein